MFLLFLTTVQLNARIPQKLASWTLSYSQSVVLQQTMFTITCSKLLLLIVIHVLT